MKPGRENVVLFLCWNKDDIEHRQEAGLRRFVKAAGWTLVTKRVCAEPDLRAGRDLRGRCG